MLVIQNRVASWILWKKPHFPVILVISALAFLLKCLPAVSCQVSDMGLTSGDLEKIRKLLHEETKSIFNDEYLKSISDNILKCVSEKYDDVLDQHKNDIASLKQSVSCITQWKEKMEKQLDSSEQFSRSLNIRIFGINEEKNEDLHKTVTDLFKNKLKITSISESDLKKCHRIASKIINIDKPRPAAIMVRFSQDKVRKMVLKNRGFLKNTGIQIQEDLTKLRLRLLDTAIKKFTKNNVWCSNGVILVKINNIVHRIESEAELNNIKLK